VPSTSGRRRGKTCIPQRTVNQCDTPTPLPR
jgi:hypothetical protein